MTQGKELNYPFTRLQKFLIFSIQMKNITLPHQCTFSKLCMLYQKLYFNMRITTNIFRTFSERF
jgi:hypothetical protein